MSDVKPGEVTSEDFSTLFRHIKGLVIAAQRDNVLPQSRAKLLDLVNLLELSVPPRPVRPVAGQLPTARRRPQTLHAGQLIESSRPTREQAIQYFQQQERQWYLLDQRWQQENSFRLRFVKNLRAEISTEEVPTQIGQTARTLPWRLLPPSKMNQQRVIAAIREYQIRNPDLIVDEGRLREAYALKPEGVYVGLDEFEGYFVFAFSAESKVLLEHPVVGNAAYVFGRNWRELSRLSKTQLIRRARRESVRVIHKGNWRAQVRDALAKMAGGLRRSRSPRRTR